MVEIKNSFEKKLILIRKLYLDRLLQVDKNNLVKN